MDSTNHSTFPTGRPKSPFKNIPKMSLTLNIKDYQTKVIESKQRKYDDFIQSLKNDHFPELRIENQLILTQGWNPVIPQSINSTIEEVLQNTVPQFKVLSLNSFLLDMAHRQIELQEANIQFQVELTKDIWRMKYQELDIQYNKLTQEYQLLQSSYRKYLETIDKKKVIKDNSTIVASMNQFACKLLDDKEAAEQQYQNLFEDCSNLQTSIQQYKQLIVKLDLENQELKNQLKQLQEQLQQMQIQTTNNIPQKEQDQKKQTKIKIKIQEINTNDHLKGSTTKTIEQQISQFQEKFHSSKEIKKDNSESSSQLFNCGYCNKGCPEYIELPCLQRYHLQCFEDLGRKSMDHQSSVYCKCSMKIQTKLFAKETQFLLLAHQASLIFQNYQNSLSLKKCKDCEFFYKFEIKSYCPNCLQYKIES